MNRLFVVFSGMLLLTACSPQLEYGFSAGFHNACDTPLRVIARSYSNTLDPLDLDVQVNPDERVIILDRVGYSDDPEDPDNGIPSNYGLELSANGKQRSFDRGAFLDLLNKSKYKFSWRIHAWTINDPSLCP
jgi:hypothetical protein